MPLGGIVVVEGGIVGRYGGIMEVEGGIISYYGGIVSVVGGITYPTPRLFVKNKYQLTSW